MNFRYVLIGFKFVFKAIRLFLIFSKKLELKSIKIKIESHILIKYNDTLLHS